MAQSRLQFKVYENKPRSHNIIIYEGQPLSATYYIWIWDFTGGEATKSTSAYNEAEIAIIDRGTGNTVLRRDSTQPSPEITLGSTTDGQVIINVDLKYTTMSAIPAGRYDYSIFATLLGQTSRIVLISGIMDNIETHIEVSMIPPE